MQKFDPAKAIPGTVLHDIDASSLLAGRDEVEQTRLDDQHYLLATNTRRTTMIKVSCAGVIIGGNHGARAAAETDTPVEVYVVDFPQPSYGPILTIPVVPR